MTQRICIANPAFIGDVLFSSRLCDALVKANANTEILFLAKPPAHQLARHFPGVTETIAFDKRGKHKGWQGIRAMADVINRFQPDVFITPHRGWRMAFLARCLGKSVRKICFKGFWQFLFDVSAPFYGTESFFQKEARLLKCIGISSESAHMSCGGPWASLKREVILAPGANWATKRWPASSFVALAQAMTLEGWQVALTGGPDEMDLCAEIHKNAPQIQNRCGESLEEAMKCMREAALVVANDSGLAHLSRAIGTPTVMIFGPTSWKVHELDKEVHIEVAVQDLDCAPCSAHGDTTCPKGHHRCMLELPVSEVQKKSERLLAR